MAKKAAPRKPHVRPGRKKGVIPDVATPREALFVEGVLEGLTYTAAYKRAGYTPKNDNVAGNLASLLLKKPRVARCLADGRAKLADRWAATQDRILEELVNLGYSDIRKIFNEDGTLKNPTVLDDRTAVAVQSVEVIERPGLIDKKTIETVHKIKFHGKVESLTLMARLQGLLKDKVEHSGTVHHVDETASDEELVAIARRIIETAEKRAKSS